MITAVDSHTHEYHGLSTDQKPVEYVGNGSVFFEMDTCKVYMFDATEKKWLELA